MDAELALKIIYKNSPELLSIVDKIGGPGVVLKLAPDFYKLFQTLNEHNAAKPEEALPMQYGDETFLKVKAFQKKHGLGVDGIVGDRTWAKVEELVKK